MSAGALSERLQDAVGPIVVKEVRQGLRGRVFAVFFALLLLACLGIALIAVAAASESRGSEQGRDFLAAFLVAMGVVVFFVIPYTAFRSMVREREDETWVLLALTGLGARSIVRGKFTSALSQALLYASACAPFVVFSYYLNGVDILQVLLALGMAAVWSCFLVALGVAVATLAESRIGRAVAHFVVLGLLAAASAAAFGFSVVLAEEGSRILRDDVFVGFCAAFVVVVGGATPVLLEGAAANLALPSENSARGPRLALAAYFVALWAVGVGGVILGNAEKGVPALASVATSLLLVVAGLFAASEHDGWPRSTQHAGWLKPGALRGWRLVLVLLVLSTGVWLVLYQGAHGSDHLDRAFHTLLAAPLYVVLYLSAAAFFGRVTPLRRLGEAMGVRLAFAVLTAAGIAVPPLLALLAGERPNARLPNHLNPLIGLVNFVDKNRHADARLGLGLLLGASVVFVILAWAAMAARDKERHA